MASLQSNRLAKYVLYAIGEIILVTIGILIALYINNQNEVAKTEAKIESLFRNIQKDILVDVNMANNLIAMYETKDSLIDLVLDEKVTLDDYKENPELTALITTYVPHKIKDNGYSNLMRYSDFIPAKYDSLLLMLDNLYLTDQLSVKEMNTQVSSHVIKMLDKWAEKYSWYVELNRTGRSKEAAEYFLNSPIYKNEAITYQIFAADNLLTLIKSHKLNAVMVYKEITKLLGNEEPEPSLISDFYITLSKAQLQTLMGTYQINANFDVRIFLEDGFLYAQATGQGPFIILPKSKTLFFSPVVNAKIEFIENEKGEIAQFELIQQGVRSSFIKVETEEKFE